MPLPDGQSPQLNPALQALRLVARAIAAVVIIVWLVLEELLFPLFRPLFHWLSGLKLFEAVGRLINWLPPYAVLVLLAVPFVLIEPLKVYALYLMATGVFVRGLLLFIFSHVLSLFTLDRLYHTGKPQLMKIGWFAKLMGWIGGLRDWALGWARSTAAWKWAVATFRAARDWLRNLVRSAG